MNYSENMACNQHNLGMHKSTISRQDSFQFFVVTLFFFPFPGLWLRRISQRGATEHLIFTASHLWGFMENKLLNILKLFLVHTVERRIALLQRNYNFGHSVFPNLWSRKENKCEPVEILVKLGSIWHRTINSTGWKRTVSSSRDWLEDCDR